MRFRVIVIAALLCSGLSQVSAAEDRESLLEGLDAREGLVNLYWKEDKGQVLVEIPKDLTEVLHVTSLPSGVGSNDIGLDRGQLGWTRVVEFQRSGPRLLIVQPNKDYRAVSDNPDEQQAVADAFARSILASLEIKAENDQAWVVDYTDFLLTDVHGVVSRLDGTGQGSFRLDKKRSAPIPEQLKSFPDNSVAEALITFNSDKPGSLVNSVTPTPGAVTVRMRHEFVRLPDAGYQPRAYHPRSGYFPFAFKDYAVPLNQSIDRRYIVRHRIDRDEQGQIKPLIYYVDRGAPEPIRSALIEGASWWAQAFESAGLPNYFQVKVLPEGADPMDVRYNVIQWVHRSTRGWSYGASVVDPRTGEILKGHISLGSLRVRQDMMIAEGLLGPYSPGSTSGGQVEQMALARLRQLSAHEVGHTLGLAHNFAASANADASVMDYPHPYVRLDTNGEIDLRRAYDRDIGEWDKLAIQYGYREFASPAAEATGLAEILQQAIDDKLRFISDPDTRGAAMPHAQAHLWDNGEDALSRFEELMTIRKKALARFDAGVLKEQETLAELERKLVPVYLMHRYQAEAAAKSIGGLDYDYVLKGDALSGPATVAADRQRRALDQLLVALSPQSLMLPESLLVSIPPAAYGYSRDREYLAHQTSVAFDYLSAPRAGAQLILNLLLNRERLARVYQQRLIDGSQLGLQEFTDELLDSLFSDVTRSGYRGAVAREVVWLTIRQYQRMAADVSTSEVVKATAFNTLTQIQNRLKRTGGSARSFATAAINEIQRFVDEPTMEVPPAYPIPPGSPI